MEIKNCMEDLVFEQLDRVIAKNRKSCSCPQCRADIAALALNFLPARYIVTRKGEIYTKCRLLEQQFGVDIVTAITHAVKIVGKAPHHTEGESI